MKEHGSKRSPEQNSGWDATPQDALNDAWTRLRRAVVDGRHPFRHPVVATRCERRGISARTVVLRGASQEDGVLVLHSDLRAEKVAALRTDPTVSWCFYDPRKRLQLRAESVATLHHRDPLAELEWERQSDAARRLYGVAPAPGTELGEGSGPSFDAQRGFASFVVVRCTLTELDWLQLGRSGHRRIRSVRRGSDWDAAPIVP
ncbi:MAG: hypothetical protein AAFU73_06410 [Planctomycetota bacterium]